MKKVCIIFLLSIIISLTAFGFGAKMGNDGGRYALNVKNPSEYSEFLRIHIRADSNENGAQTVKYSVRDRVVEYLTPFVSECESKDEAIETLRGKTKEIESVASLVLEEKGFSYGAEAELTVENFPTRVYGEYTLPSGEYVALIIRLGKGEGDNWWCVVYPPLCFAGNNADLIYKSKIKEIIEAWQAKRS